MVLKALINVINMLKPANKMRKIVVLSERVSHAGVPWNEEKENLKRKICKVSRIGK